MKRIHKKIIWPNDRNIVIFIFYQQEVNVFNNDGCKKKTISNIYVQRFISTESDYNTVAASF